MRMICLIDPSTRRMRKLPQPLLEELDRTSSARASSRRPAGQFRVRRLLGWASSRFDGCEEPRTDT